MRATDVSSLASRLRDDGVVFLEQALAPEWLRMAEAAYRWSVDHPGGGASDISGRAPGRFYQDLANPKAHPAYRPLLEQSPIADLVAALWSTPDVWFLYEQVFLKEGGAARRTPWHQDSSYLPVEGERLAVLWITFEPVPKEGALELVRGSHRGTLYDGSSFDPDDDTAPLYGDGRLPRLPDIEQHRSRWDIVSWAVEPGDLLVFHPAMLHGGAPTTSRRRRTLSLRFFGDDVVYRPRGQWALKDAEPAGSAEPRGWVFDRLDETLSPGDPLRHPEFPKVRPR